MNLLGKQMLVILFKRKKKIIMLKTILKPLQSQFDPLEIFYRYILGEKKKRSYCSKLMK